MAATVRGVLYVGGGGGGEGDQYMTTTQLLLLLSPLLLLLSWLWRHFLVLAAVNVRFGGLS